MVLVQWHCSQKNKKEPFTILGLVLILNASGIFPRSFFSSDTHDNLYSTEVTVESSLKETSKVLCYKSFFFTDNSSNGIGKLSRFPHIFAASQFMETGQIIQKRNQVTKMVNFVCRLTWTKRITTSQVMLMCFLQSCNVNVISVLSIVCISHSWTDSDRNRFYLIIKYLSRYLSWTKLLCFQQKSLTFLLQLLFTLNKMSLIIEVLMKFSFLNLLHSLFPI